MKESDIVNIINSNSIPELLNKMGKFYPSGFDVDKVDKRIKDKMEQLENKFAKYNNSIEDIRRESTY